MGRSVFLLLSLAALVVAWAAGAASAAVQYHQPTPIPPGMPGYRGYSWVSSETDLGGQHSPMKAFDSFILAQPAVIETVAWSGSYGNGPNPYDVDSFSVTFWADGDNKPSGALYTATIGGNAHQTVFYVSDWEHWCNHWTDLPVPFVANANQKYWLSVIANHYIHPQWGWLGVPWADGVGDGKFWHQYETGEGYLGDTDLAFTLSGSAVPEPASIVLWSVLAACGLGARCWRREP